jgi:hypothetical protein
MIGEAFLRNRRTYFGWILRLLTPGHAPPVLKADRNIPAEVGEWSENEVKLLIEEGRRHHDRTIATVDEARKRAQLGFTTGFALLVVQGSQLHRVSKLHCWYGSVIYWASVTLVILGWLGMLSVLSVPLRLSVIHAAVVTYLPRPVDRSLASEYAEAVVEGENAANSLLTVFRESMLYLTLGAALDGAVWILLQ